MTNELTQYDNTIDSLIAKFTTEKAEGFPSVKWTEDAVTDADGKVVKIKGKTKMKGVFEVTGYDDYLDSIKFKPLAVFYQYLRWNDSNDAVECQSIYFDDWRKEPYDTEGTLRCGRPAKKAFEQLGLEEQKAWRKKVTVYMHTFGLVETPDGDILVNLKVSGGKFKSLGDALATVKGSAYYTKAFDISLVKSTEHDGYDFSIAEDDSYVVEDPYVIMEDLKTAVTHVADSNKFIMKKYKEALTGDEEDTKLVNVITEEVDVIDDEIPFD